MKTSMTTYPPSDESTRLLKQESQKGIFEKYIPAYTEFNQETMKVSAVAASILFFGLLSWSMTEKVDWLAYSSVPISICGVLPASAFEIYHRGRLGWNAEKAAEELKQQQPPSRFYSACTTVSSKTLPNSKNITRNLAIITLFVSSTAIIGLFANDFVGKKISSTNLIAYDSILTLAAIISFCAFTALKVRFQHLQEIVSKPVIESV